MALMLSIAAHAQVYNYTYDYTIKKDGTTEVNRYPAYSREYSLNYNGTDFFFCFPDGRTLPCGWMHNTDDGTFRNTYTSDNKGHFQSTIYVDKGKLKGEYDYYLVNGHGEAYIPYLGTNKSDKPTTIWVSKDRSQLVFPSENVTLVFKRIPKRTIAQHVPMCPVLPTPTTTTQYPSGGGVSTTTPMTTSGNSNNGTLVGSFSAFGIGQGYGNVVTYSQVFSVYRDNGGYYIIDPVNHVQRHLSYNSRSSYLGYSVSNYNYWVMTSGSDISWFFRL